MPGCWRSYFLQQRNKPLKQFNDHRNMSETTKPKRNKSLKNAVKDSDAAKNAEAEAKQRQLEADVEEHIQRMGVTYYPKENKYYIKDGDGVWTAYLEGHFCDILTRRHGLPKPKDKERFSPMVNLLLEETRYNRVVDYAGPLCGRPSGYLKIGGMRALITQGPELIEPVEGKWPHLNASFRGLLGGISEPHKDHQLASFYAWLQVAVRSIREYRITQAPALAVAGPAGCGKSVLLQVIVAALGGRQAQPLPYMNAETPFNSDLFNAECLIFDDDGINDSKADRHKLGQELKKMTVATKQARWHAKGREARSIPAWWRVIFCLNDSEESLQVLPPLDDGIRDKILLLRASRYTFPFKGNPTEDEVQEVFHKEMPHFLHWLLNVFVIPESVANARFGVAGWAHPELAEALSAMDQDTQLLALIDEAADAVFITGAGGVWQGTSTQLHRILLDDGRTASSSRRLLPYAVKTSKLLQRLIKSCPTRVSFRRTGKERTYTILELFADGTVAEMPRDDIER